jgi:hypothetical protein
MSWDNYSPGVVQPYVGQVYVFRSTITGAATTAAKDVVIHNANAPFAYRIIGLQLFSTVSVSVATAQLRDALASAGTALFAALDATTPGLIPLPTTTTASATVAAGGTLVLRCSDSKINGEVVVTAVREG